MKTPPESVCRYVPSQDRQRNPFFARLLAAAGVASMVLLASASYSYASLYQVYTSSTSAMSINASDGYCSLAEAIASANAGHSRYNCPELSSDGEQAIQLIEAAGKPFANYHYNITSLTINSPYGGVRMYGNSDTSRAFIDSTGPSGIIVQSGSRAFISFVNFTFTGGSAGGRPMENYGILESYSVTFANGNVTTHPNGTGGAIYNAGTIDFMQDTIIKNSHAKKGGGIYNFGGSVGGLERVTISGNQATTAGGGIYNANSPSSLGSISYIQRLLIDSNRAVTGGGIFNKGTVFLENTTISNNVASGTGSGEVDKYNNTCDGMGGGIESIYVNLTIGVSYTELFGGTISGNSASSSYRGGAIGGDRLAEIIDPVTFSDNGSLQCRWATATNRYGLITGCP